MFPGNKPHCPTCGCHFSIGHKKQQDGSTIPCVSPLTKVIDAVAALLARASPNVSP